MCCLAEIAMFVMGIVTLVKGSFMVSRKRVVQGTPAYVIGGILVAVLPVALVLGFVIGFVITVSTGRQPTVQELSAFAAVDVAVVLLALIAVMIIGFASAKEPTRNDHLTAPQGPAAMPPFRPVDPNNPYASPQTDERDRLLDEMQ